MRGVPGLTEDLIVRIATGVSAGAPVEVSARAQGVAHRTLHDWLKRGKAPGPGDHLYVQLVNAIEMAKGQRLLRNHTKIATSPDWRAAAWDLEDQRRIEQLGPKGLGAVPTINVVIEQKQPTRRAAGAADEADLPDSAPAGVVIEVSARRSSRAASEARTS